MVTSSLTLLFSGAPAMRSAFSCFKAYGSPIDLLSSLRRVRVFMAVIGMGEVCEPEAFAVA